MHSRRKPTTSPRRATTRVRATELAADLALRLAGEAIAALAQVNVVSAPLKGIMLLTRWPDLRGHRDLADVDLLVMPEDFSRAEESLGTLGFEPTSRTNRGTTLVRDDWPLSIDLHHRLFGPHLFDMPTTALMGRAERDETSFAAPVMRLADMDFLGHVIGHAVKSRVSPDENSVFDDIAWLLGELPIDPGACAAHMQALRMRRAAGYVLGAAASKGQPLARAIVRHLELDVADRAAIEAARAFPGAYWNPHLLNECIPRGARSFSAQLRQDLSWRARRWMAPAARA